MSVFCELSCTISVCITSFPVILDSYIRSHFHVSNMLFNSRESIQFAPELNKIHSFSFNSPIFFHSFFSILFFHERSRPRSPFNLSFSSALFSAWSISSIISLIFVSKFGRIHSFTTSSYDLSYFSFNCLIGT